MRVARPMDGTAATCPPAGVRASCGGARRFECRHGAVGRQPSIEGSLDQYWSHPQLSAELHEQGLERERGTEIELLEGAPGLADELAGALRGREPPDRTVLGEDR